MPYSLRQIDSFGEIGNVNRDPALKTRSTWRYKRSATEVAVACEGLSVRRLFRAQPKLGLEFSHFAFETIDSIAQFGHTAAF